MIVDSNDLPSKLDARILPQLVCVLLLCVANALAVGPSSDQSRCPDGLTTSSAVWGQDVSVSVSVPLADSPDAVQKRSEILVPPQRQGFRGPSSEVPYPRVRFPGSRDLVQSNPQLRFPGSRDLVQSNPQLRFSESRSPVRSYPQLRFSESRGPVRSYPRRLFSGSVQSSSVATRSQALMQGSILSPNNGSAAFLPRVEKPTPLLLPPSLNLDPEQ